MRLCKLLGHKWGDGKYEQTCRRRNCSAWRAVYVKKFPKFQEPASDWQVFDPQDLKFKKPNKMKRLWLELPEYARVLFIFVGCAVGVIAVRQLIALILWVI